MMSVNGNKTIDDKIFNSEWVFVENSIKGCSPKESVSLRSSLTDLTEVDGWTMLPPSAVHNVIDEMSNNMKLIKSTLPAAAMQENILFDAAVQTQPKTRRAVMKKCLTAKALQKQNINAVRKSPSKVFLKGRMTIRGR